RRPPSSTLFPTRRSSDLIAERRMGMLSSYNFHMIAALYDDDPEPAGVIVGIYLDGVNAGFVTYLAVRRQHRGRRIARVLRPHLRSEEHTSELQSRENLVC